MRHQLRKGVAASLEIFDLEGFTGDVTATIYDETSEFKAATTITPPTSTATLTASASRKARELSVDTTVGFKRGQVAVVVPATGIRFPIEILGVEAGKLHLKNPLRSSLNANDTVVLCTVEVSLTSDETSDLKRDLRVLWEYTNALGKNVYKSQYFDIVTDPWTPMIDEDVLAREDSTVGEYLGGNVNLKDSVDGAQGAVEAWLRSRQKYPDLYRFRDDLDRAVALYTLERLYMATKNIEMANHFAEKGLEQLTMILNSKAWYDIGDDLNKGTVDTDTGLTPSTDELGYVNTSEMRSPINRIRVG